MSEQHEDSDIPFFPKWDIQGDIFSNYGSINQFGLAKLESIKTHLKRSNRMLNNKSLSHVNNYSQLINGFKCIQLA